MDSQFPQIKVTHNIGNTITIPNQLDVKVFTYLNTNIIAGTASLPVDNATDFTDTSTPILVSQMGAENSEIVIQASNTTNTIACSSTLFPHNRGDIVQELNYDQIVVSWCATIGGTYAVLSTSTFQTTQQNTIVFHPAGLLTTFYKVQWKNSITGALSDLSDPISVSTYLPTSVAQIIYPVLKAMGVSENDPKINTDFCLSAVNDARKYVAAKLYGIRQAWQQNFEFPIQILAGTNYVDLPDNIEFKETDRSVLAARFLIGNVLTPYNLRYIDKRSYNQIAFSVMGGYSTVLANIGDTTVSVDSAGDFPNTAGGVAYVATTDFTQTIMQIAYTAVDLTNNQLTGVTGITRSIPVGTRVWSRPTISQPIYYTVFGDKMFFDRIIPDSMQGENVYIDYYTLISEVTDLTQILPENYREMYKFYLRWAIKYRKDISLSSGDPDLGKFEDLVQALFNNLYSGQDTTVITN
jgi:hypothetical protein